MLQLANSPLFILILSFIVKKGGMTKEFSSLFSDVMFSTDNFFFFKFFLDFGLNAEEEPPPPFSCCKVI